MQNVDTLYGWVKMFISERGYFLLYIIYINHIIQGVPRGFTHCDIFWDNKYSEFRLKWSLLYRINRLLESKMKIPNQILYWKKDALWNQLVNRIKMAWTNVITLNGTRCSYNLQPVSRQLLRGPIASLYRHHECLEYRLYYDKYIK